MAHKKAGSSTQYGRDSISKRLGVKVFGNQAVKQGAVIIRQHGTKFHPGKNVRMGGDSTLYALTGGTVKFSSKMVRKYHGNLRRTRFVHVEPGKTKKTA